ncbi:MAG TPA: ATP-binding protein [Actinomycetota bacterium]
MALVAAAVALVMLLRAALTEDVRLAARLRAEAVADLIAATEPSSEISLGDTDEEFVQVLAPGGEVVSSTENVADRPSVVALEPGESRRVEVPFEDDPFLAVARGDGGLLIVVGRSLDGVIEVTRTVVGLLAIGFPLLLLVVALVTRRVVGRALAPVEAIRSEVDAISSSELHRRVPVPRAGDEISRLATTMNRMLNRLQRGQDRQRRFVSDASHELRSPVASIRQHAELALTHPAASSPKDLARTVLDEDLRLQQLVENLLLLARMDERGEARLRPVDLDEIASDEVGRLRRVDGRSIDTDGLSGGRMVGDPRQLGPLVRNLLDNAVRHARGHVALALFEDGDQVVLRVDDDGPGIAQESRERVFERFVRLEDARDRDSGGSGLGLSIVAEVARAHGGSVELVDSPLGGARFEVRLPRAD